ncbi:hypothetical protein LMG23992_01533 [Cupriavidus laharis]|uniref:Uncharacterized protein n=2 Tax=Cupriavidus laharis TaxID=151654 RepID=A0ABN7YCA5_9BURK|nr:hypothetical protein LMG23992_01533 [Cupriavidus laharis]
MQHQQYAPVREHDARPARRAAQDPAPVAAAQTLD